MSTATRPAVERLLRPERTMVRVRWAAVGFGLVQVLTYYRPYPPGVLVPALGLVGLLAVANVGIWWASRRVRSGRDATVLSLVALATDTLVVLGLVWVYTFDPDTAMFALVYFVPLEGAIRFQLPGALWSMAAAAAGYAARELYGTAVFGNEFLLTSISFRMGIGFIIAVVAGTMASTLVRERDELQAAKAELEQTASALVDTNAELQAANEVKDDFIAVTNHELRTPLTTILGYTAMMIRRWDTLPDDRKEAFVRTIDQQGRRLLALVEDLLTVSSAHAGALELRMEPVEVCTVVDQAIAFNGEAAMSVRNACPPGTQVLADPDRLCQILINYVSNALKYGRPPVVVVADPDADDGQVVITVSDDGPGVPERFVPQLFDKFSQASRGASRTAAGTGLGLAIVRQLVEAQGGAAWYEPGPQGGARFSVRLPAVAGGQGPRQTRGPH
jgi:signal transduction histidine kinase